jgi:hypothetical protein
MTSDARFRWTRPGIGSVQTPPFQKLNTRGFGGGTGRTIDVEKHTGSKTTGLNIFQWMIKCVSLRLAGSVTIMEVVSTQLYPQEVEIKCAEKAGQLMPRHKHVNEAEDLNKDLLKETRLEIGLLHCQNFMLRDPNLCQIELAKEQRR